MICVVGSHEERDELNKMLNQDEMREAGLTKITASCASSVRLSW